MIYGKKKIILIIIIIISVIIVMVMLNKKKKEEKDINQIDIVFNAKNYDCTFYYDESVNTSFAFDVASNIELDKKKFSLEMDLDIDYEFCIERNEEQEDEWKYYLFQCYKGVNWKEKAKLYMKDPNEYVEQENKYLEEYEKGEKKEKIYLYTVTVRFLTENITEDKRKNEICNEIHAYYNGKKYDLNIGKISIRKSFNEQYVENGLELNSIAVVDYLVIQNNNGYIDYNALNINVLKDVDIVSIRTSNDDINVESVKFQIEDKYGKEINCKFGNNLKINKNSKVNMSVKLKNKMLKNKFSFLTTFFLIIDYKVNGKKYTIFQDVMARTKNNGYEIYAYYKDNVNILSFYTDFYYPCMEKERKIIQ